MDQGIDALQRFIDKVNAKECVVGIIGLGYVGIPLAGEFVRNGFSVVGFDCDTSKIEKLKAGRSYIDYIPDSKIADMNATGLFDVTADISRVSFCDAVLICLPTPLTVNREPDVSYIRNIAADIAPHVGASQLIVLESTTYPGTTAEIIAGGVCSGQDDPWIGYSPEREDPNNPVYTTENIPKVVSGMDAPALSAVSALYGHVFRTLVPVSNCETAEATKLVENIFRCVNIAMVNELKLTFDKMGIDVWEVIDAAKTKPFGYMAFYPGPGIGGHCIPIDPFYLTWKAREYDSQTRFIELAGEINREMPYFVVQKTMKALNEKKKSLNGSRVLVIGIAYKKNVDDMRESPSTKIIELLELDGAHVDFHDPHIQNAGGRVSVPLSLARNYDCVVISTNHDCINYTWLAENCDLIVDTRNAMNGINGKVRVIKA